MPERVRNLPMFLSEEQAHSGTHASDRLFFDLIRASQMGNIILVSLPSEAALKNEDGQPNRRTPEQAALKVPLLLHNVPRDKIYNIYFGNVNMQIKIFKYLFFRLASQKHHSWVWKHDMFIESHK